MLAISQATISASGVVTVDFTVTDGSGVPLDYAGVYTTGAVDAKWVLSWLGEAPSDDGRRAARVHRVHDAAPRERRRQQDGAPLPDSDTGGTLTEIGVGQGTYEYIFGTKLPAGFDGTKTHTVGVWATRVFGGLTYVVNTLYDFVPQRRRGDRVTRDIVTTQACNQCHNPLGYHEGNTARRDVAALRPLPRDAGRRREQRQRARHARA